MYYWVTYTQVSCISQVTYIKIKLESPTKMYSLFTILKIEYISHFKNQLVKDLEVTNRT